MPEWDDGTAPITEHGQAEIDGPNASARTPVVFVHGRGLHSADSAGRIG